jgi:hypothetical protein
LESIRSEKPCVLLIDEVDRADEALEAVLLETLAEFQVSVPEVGTFTTDTPPYVILTSNNTRDLSAALKRRCLHLFLDYPSAERELEIVRSKDTGLPEALAKQLVDIVRGLRELELRKAPSISETIDWARTLAVLGMEELNAPSSRTPRRWSSSTTRTSARPSAPCRDSSTPTRRCPKPATATGTATRGTAVTVPLPPTAPTWTTVLARVRRRTGWQARRGLRQPAAVGPPCHGRSPAGAARRHLEPGQPLFRAGPQARPVTVAPHVSDQVRPSWKGNDMASSRHWFETVAEAQRRAKKRLPKSVYMALVAAPSRASP